VDILHSSNYLTGHYWEYVKDPEVVKEKMKSRYGAKEISVEIIKIQRMDDKSNLENGDWVDVSAITVGKNYFGKEVEYEQLYHLQKTQDGFKVGWMESLGLSDMSWDAYKAQRPMGNFTFRAAAKLDNYYNYGFRGAENTYYSVMILGDETDLLPEMYGYIKKDTDSGRALFDLLKDGKAHRVILEIAYVRASQGRDDIVLISDLIQKGWIIP
jgi:hypothetical protein